MSYVFNFVKRVELLFVLNYLIYAFHSLFDCINSWFSNNDEIWFYKSLIAFLRLLFQWFTISIQQTLGPVPLRVWCGTIHSYPVTSYKKTKFHIYKYGQELIFCIYCNNILYRHKFHYIKRQKKRINNRILYIQIIHHWWRRSILYYYHFINNDMTYTRN